MSRTSFHLEGNLILTIKHEDGSMEYYQMPAETIIPKPLWLRKYKKENSGQTPELRDYLHYFKTHAAKHVIEYPNGITKVWE